MTHRPRWIVVLLVLALAPALLLAQKPAGDPTGGGLGDLARLSHAKSRSISPENFTGEKGKGGMATTRNSGLCQSGFMGYAVNYGVGDLAVFTSNPIPADITVGGTISLKIYSVDPAQSAWTAAQSPFIQVEVDALDEAGNYLEPVAAASIRSRSATVT